MVQASPPARRLQPATIALAVAALIALVVLVYTLAFRGDGGASADAGASAPGANAAMAAGPDEQAQIAGAEARIRALQDALRQDPDNHQAWFELGTLYRAFSRLDEAAQAFRRAAELQPSQAIYSNFLGEMLLIAANRANRPLDEAERYFRRGLELQPGNAMSRFYLATIKDRRGDHRGAVDDLIDLLRNPPQGEPVPPQVRNAVVSLAQQHNIDISDRLPPDPAPTAGTTAPTPSSGSGAQIATAGIPGPTQDQLRAASGMTPTQQNEMGRGMVERLAGRLRQNPRDAPRWIMLMRSRMALGEPQLAAEALRTALATFRNDAATQAQLRDAARALGVPAS